MVFSARGIFPSLFSFLAISSLAVATLSLPARAITLDEFNGEQSLSANQTTQTNFSPASDATIMGGTRKIKLTWLSGANAINIDTDATVVKQSTDGTFVYSQDSSVAAQSLISWDGTALASPAANLFANGLNLQQDNGTAFAIEVLGNDLATQLEISVTDATDTSKISTATIELEAGAARTVLVPFSSLNGNASLQSVGAISLLINKSASQAVDLSLTYIGTNGQCRRVPDSNGRVIDECGVCGGNNSSCADCAGTPNGAALLDQCGVCSGNGTSCLDCAGVVNGAAIVDRCNVCNGDGASCFGCTQKDITFLIATLDSSAKSQEALIKNIYRQIERSTKRVSVRKKTAALRAQVHALQIRNWTVSWSIPRISTTCLNTQFCASVSNEKFIEEYRRNSESLRQMTVDGLKLWQKVNPKARLQISSYLRKATRLHADNLTELKTVPASQSVCT